MLLDSLRLCGYARRKTKRIRHAFQSRPTEAEWDVDDGVHAIDDEQL